MAGDHGTPAIERDATATTDPRVLLVSDSPLILQGLKRMLALQHFTEVHTAASHAEAEAMARTGAAAVLVVETSDVSATLPFLARLRAAAADAPLVVIAPPDRGSFLAALRAGARGFIGRDASTTELGTSIRVVARGEWAVPRTRMGDLAESYRALPTRDAPPGLPPLTDRELAVLRLLAQGVGAQQIGAEIYCSESVVRTVIASLVRRFGVANRIQLVTEVVQRGLLPQE